MRHTAFTAMLLFLCHTVSGQITGITATCNPTVLSVQHDSIEFALLIEFPKESVNKNERIMILPTLVSADRHYYLDTIFVGGNATNEAIKIVSQVGGKIYRNVKVKYREEFKNVSVSLQFFSAGKNGRNKELFSLNEVAKGTITTLLDIEKAFQLIGIQSKPEPIDVSKSFKIYVKPDGDIDLNSKINKESLESKELKDLKQLLSRGYSIKDLEIGIYWPPEGELSSVEQKITEMFPKCVPLLNTIMGPPIDQLNKELIEIRAYASERSVFLDELKKIPCEIIPPEDIGLIKRILEMYADPSEAQKEINNVLKTYTALDTVMERLYQIDYQFILQLPVPAKNTIQQLYDSELVSFPSEWMLYAAENSLKGMDTSLLLTCGIYNLNWRALNTIGMMERENIDSSIFYLTNSFNASSYDPKGPSLAVLNNLGATHAKKQDLMNAEVILRRARTFNSASDKEAISVVNENLTTLYLLRGKYSDASVYSSCGYNAAMARLAIDNLPGALKALDCIDTKDARGYYLGAVIHARSLSEDKMIENLKRAFEIEPELKQKAKNDLEFYTFRHVQSFKQLIEQ